MPTGVTPQICKIIVAMALFLIYTPTPASAVLQSVVGSFPGPLQIGITWVEQEGVDQ